MLTHLEVAKRRGATIVAVNPLPEAGLLRFRNPQTPRGVVGPGTVLADTHLQVRLAGDQALFQGLGRYLLEAEDLRPGSVLDHDFLGRHTAGFEAYAAAVRAVPWEEIERDAGIGRAEIEALGARLAASRRTIVCWAMGLTQHRNAVASIKEVVNVLLLQGNIGKPGAGVFPVRGHSNDQGDRTASSTPSAGSSASSRPGPTASTPSTPSRPWPTGGSGPWSAWAATWCGPSPTPRWPRPRSGTCA
jgi:anaerobic selenocysteine-containing dehydrogenase